MRIALIAPPFITVPPQAYGGTELFIAHLAEELQRQGAEVVVYTNRESTVNVAKECLFDRARWPLRPGDHAELDDADHTSWAVEHASRTCDIIHLNAAPGIALSRFCKLPFIYTLHHPNEEHLSRFYGRFRDVNYVCISHFQQQRETMPKTRTIHHGINLSDYRLVTHKQQYLSFIGRIAPIKGTHLAIQIAKETGIPLKIAGEIQPINRDYFEQKVKPHVDGKFIEYVGLADLAAKNELLGNSLAMVFPILWNEPFGLVMVEAMACGTPVLALNGGSVPEIVGEGVSGFIGRSVKDLVKHVADLPLPAEGIRRYVAQHFSLERMASDYMQLYREALTDGAYATRHLGATSIPATTMP